MISAEFQAVDVDYAAIAPMLIVARGALVGVLVEAFAPRRRASRAGLAHHLTLLAACGAPRVVPRLDDRDPRGLGVVDGVSVFLMGGLLLLSA